MNPLDLNLASRPIRNNTLLWVAHAALVILLLVGTTWNVTAYVRHGQDLEGLNAERNSFESRMSDLQRRENAAQRGIRKHDLKDLNLRASKAGDVIERKALSWTRLFNRMEEVLPYEVRMATIRPVFAFGREALSNRDKQPVGSVPVSVEGSAKTLDAFFEFERALIHDPHFDRVEPHRFNRGTGGEVVFEMRFLYFPDAAEPEPAEPEGEQPPGEAVTAAVVDSPEIVEELPPADEEAAGEEQAVPESEAVTEVVVPDDAPPPPAVTPSDQGQVTKVPRSRGRTKGKGSRTAPDRRQASTDASKETPVDQEGRQ